MSNQAPTPINKLPALRAIGWISGGWVLIKGQLLRLLLISLIFQFLLGFSQIQVVGLLIILCLPLLSAGMLHAFYLVERGEKLNLSVLFIPFTVKKTFGKLLFLGVVVMLLGLMIVTVVLAGQVVDIDPAIISRIEQGDLEAIQLIDPKVIESALLAMMMGAAVSGTITYFSVPLIWFRQLGTGSALLTGLKGLGRNWKPLLLLGLILGLLALPVVLLFGSVYLSALADGSPASWLSYLLLVLGPMFQLMIFGTQYLAFRDIFDMEAPPGVLEQKKEDQLIA